VSDLLLCELHAHTTWSDGRLTLAELVDLYGSMGFNVLCVTDHSVRLDDPMPSAVDSWTWPAYLEAIRREAARALDDYGLLVIPGLELSYNYDEPELAAHALALGLSEYVSVDAGIVAALEHANDLRAALVAAHPYTPRDVMPLRSTTRIAHEPDTFRPLVQRYELFNRDEVSCGWRRRVCLPSRAATCIAPTTSPHGRRSFPARRTRLRWWTTCALAGARF
jgi:predicted metal-dependent phosphoesterase TrpH